jgi:signal transduction histidine kinase
MYGRRLLARAARRARLVPLLIALPALAAHAAVRLDHAEFAPGAYDARQPGWPVRLPDPWDRAEPPRSGEASYRLRIELPQVDELPYALYIPRAGNRMRIGVNGELLAQFGRLDSADSDYSKLPVFVHIPPAMLMRGGNELTIQVAAESGHGGGLSAVWFGAESELRPEYEARRRWLGHGSLVLGSLYMFAGLLALGFAWRLRDRLYLLFGAASLLWAFRTVHVLVAEPPLSLVSWDALVGIAYGWYIVLICLFALDVLRFKATATRRLLVAFGALTPVAALLSYPGGVPQVWTLWLAGMLLISAGVGSAIIAQAMHRPNADNVLLAVTSVVSVVAGARDYFYYRSSIDAYGSFSVTRYVAIGFTLAMAWVLVSRFARALRAEEDAKRALEERIAQRERSLEANYERLREYERDRAAFEERRAIMQDMHDALAPRLSRSLGLVERGELDERGVSRMLHELLDELGLAIDTLSSGYDNFFDALDNLRYRIEPRFRDAGVALRIERPDAPEALVLPVVRSLQILRLVHEALVNILAHARARRATINVALRGEPPELVIEVSDNGVGFDPSRPATGRGLAAMRRGASVIGANLQIVSREGGGSRVSFTIPLPESAGRASLARPRET